jgi:hypothetical protein
LRLTTANTNFMAGWDETRWVLEEAELFWVSTVRADGWPHVIPVVVA